MVDLAITSQSGTPMLRILFMHSIMSITGPLRLPVWRSVLIESGTKPCSMAGTALRNQKLAAPWPTSKMMPRSRACPEVVVDLELGVDDRELLGEDVGVDIARAHLLEDQRRVGALRQPGAEIDHDRQAAEIAGLERAVDRGPGQVLVIEWAHRPVVRGFDADHDVRVLLGDGGGQLRPHLPLVVLPGATWSAGAHALADDVDEGEDADLGRVDDLELEDREIAPAGGARRRRSVVTPELKVLTIGLSESFEREWVSKAWTCMSMMPGVTYLPETSTRFALAGGVMPCPTSAILPSLIRRSAGPSMLLAGSMTCPPCSSTSWLRPSIITLNLS